MSSTDHIPQRDQAWLSTAAPDEIARAHAAGELAELLGAPVPVRLLPNGEQLTGDELGRLTPHQVGQAHAAGQFAALLTTNSAG